MAAVEVVPQVIPAGGLVVTDNLIYETMVAGAGNGIFFTYASGLVLAMKNDTLAVAVVTLKTPTPLPYVNQGITIPDGSFSIPDTEIWLYPVPALYANSGVITIECDQVLKIAVIIR